MSVTRPIRVLLLYASGQGNRTLSYQQSWPRAFCRDTRFSCTCVNLMDRSLTDRMRTQWTVRSWRGDLVVALHSVFSNATYLAGRLLDAVAAASPPKVFFIGNEYKLMPEKMALAERLPAALLISQSDSHEVHDLYRRRLHCAVTGIPNTGLDPDVFFPTSATSERPIDIGYRSSDAPVYLGHKERREIAEHFRIHASRMGLAVDISDTDESRRFSESEWAAFLNRCKGQIGTEAGGDHFELDDRTRLAVNAFLTAHPDTPFETVRDRFFPAPGVPMRILSGRNVEAAGMRTVQLLFEGHYGGYFKPDQHYIPLRKDLSDVDEGVRKFRDAACRESIVERAYQLVRSELTYPRLLDRFCDAVAPLL